MPSPLEVGHNKCLVCVLFSDNRQTSPESRQCTTHPYVTRSSIVTAVSQITTPTSFMSHVFAYSELEFSQLPAISPQEVTSSQVTVVDAWQSSVQSPVWSSSTLCQSSTSEIAKRLDDIGGDIYTRFACLTMTTP